MQVSVSALFTKSNIPKLARCWIKEPMQMEIKADIRQELSQVTPGCGLNTNFAQVQN